MRPSSFLAALVVVATGASCSNGAPAPSPTIVAEGSPPALASAAASSIESARLVASAAAPTTSASTAPLPDMPPPIGKVLELAGDAVPEAHRANARIAAAAFASSGVHEVTGSDYDIVLEAGAAPALAKLKDSVLVLGTDVIDALDDRAFTASEADLAATFEKALEDAGVASQDGNWVTGRVSAAKIARVPLHDRMFAIDFTIPASVGSDDTTGLVEVDAAGRASVVLMIRNDGYHSVTEARMASAWAISPPDAEGRWFVVDAFSHPWISSAWRGITYRVLERGSSPASPKVLFRESDSAYLGGEAIASVKAEADSFEVDYASWDTLGGSVTRSYVRRFRLEKVKRQRIAPWVSSPMDLAEEWLHADGAPLADAMVDSAGRADAARLWARVHDARFDGFGVITVDGKPAPALDLENLPDHVTVAFAPPVGGEAKRGGVPVPFPTLIALEARRSGGGRVGHPERSRHLVSPSPGSAAAALRAARGLCFGEIDLTVVVTVFFTANGVLAAALALASRAGSASFPRQSERAAVIAQKGTASAAKHPRSTGWPRAYTHA